MQPPEQDIQSSLHMHAFFIGPIQEKSTNFTEVPMRQCCHRLHFQSAKQPLDLQQISYVD